MNPMTCNSTRPHPFVPSGLGFAGILVFASASLAQNSTPEPPLPLQANRDARAAAAAVQAPRNLRPPPPVPSALPAPAGVEPPKPAAGSPIPPQSPDSAAPAPVSATPAPAALPTGFESKVTSSTSASGQFKVYAKDLQIRSPFASRCDEVAQKLKRLLHDDESWVLPVVVSVRTGAEAKPAGPAISTSISQITNGGFHLQVTVNVRPDLRPADIDTELARILIAERILRNKNEITTRRSMVLPEWLLTGVTQAMTFRERSRPSAVFTAIFRSGKIYGIDEILDAAPGQLDALSRTIYETSCCALVLALVEQQDGPLGMRKFLSLLAVDSRDDRALLNACFPRLALSASSLNKWWSLQMASLATPSIFETLGATESKKALAEALVLHYETTSDSAPKRTTVIAEADTPPEAAPEEEKKRGFISRILGGSSSAEKKTEEKPAATKPKAKPAEEAKAEEEATHEDKKRGIFGRMFGARGAAEDTAEEPKEEKKGGESASPKPEPKKAAKESEKPKEQPKPVAEDDGTKKPGFLGRMFGGGKTAEESPGESKEEKKSPEPKKTEKPEPKPEKKEEPKEKPTKKVEPAKPAAEEEKSEPKKRGFLGRMFGGGGESKPAEEPEKKSDKKSGSKKPDEESESGEKKKSAFVEPLDRGAEIAAQLDVISGRIVAEAVAWWSSVTGISSGHEVKLRLPFTKKKEEDGAEDSKKEEKSTAADEKRAAKKKENELEKKEEPAPKKKPEPAAKPKAKSKADAPKPRMVPVSIPLEDYANIMKRKDRSQILETTANSLRSLQTRINVLFRPIIADYIGLITELQNGKTKDIEKRLAALRARTTKAYEQAKAVETQLDVYEANETKNYSGAFEDYLRLPSLIDKELPVRDDPLSKYLDALDEEFGK